MGNYNSCFDYELMEQAANNLDETYNNINLEGFSASISNAVSCLESYDNTHDVMKNHLDNLLDYVSRIESSGEEFSSLCTGIKGGIEAYEDAEGSILLFLNKFANVIEKDLGNEKVASYIRDGKVTEDTMATSSSEFQSGATKEVTEFISNYAKYIDDNCPSNYTSSEEWREALKAKYEALGYSSYDASDLAYADMAKWRTAQTGAEVTTSAISEFAEEAYTDLEETVKTEYNELVDKYKNLGVTEEQAKELATAESEYVDANELTKESTDSWVHSESSKKYSEWQKLREKYGITEESSNNSGTASEQSADPGTKDTTTDSGNGGGGNSSGNDIQPRKTSTGTGNSSSGTNSSSQNNNSSSPSENNSLSQNQNTPSNGTEEKPSNGNENSVISEGEEKVPETPSEEKPSTTPEPETPPSNNNSNNNQTNTGENANNSGVVNNTPSTGGNTNNGNNYYAPSNNNGGGNYNSGASSNTPTTGTGTPNENASTTTPSAPESDAGINDNSGETLDVISIDKDGGKSSASTSSNDGGSVVPTILGVGVAGAAAVAGAKILHDKKKKENEYIYEEDGSTESDNSFANLESYTGDDTVDTTDTMSPGKYRAGSANNLVLEGSPSDIKIDESIADIPNQKEELE